MTLPGTFDPNLRVTPSSGWTRTTSWLLPSSSVSVSAKGRCGARLNDQRDLGDPAGQPLAGAQVERHARPAAGLHAEADGGEGLGLRLRVDAVLLPVAAGPLAGQPALLVLAADGEGLQVLGQRDRAEDLELLGADLLGGELDRLLHRGQGEQLQQVVLQHVPGGAGLLVELRPGRRCRRPRPW